MQDSTPGEPQLLAPLPLRPSAAAIIPAGLVAFGLAVALAVGIGVRAPSHVEAADVRPYTQADLGPSLVTPVDMSDPAALARARARLDLSEPETRRLDAELADGLTRLGIMAFFDDMDPDGDTVQVTGAGFSQRVTLGSGLTPIVVPYTVGAAIEVTAVYDGGGTVTVAVMTRTGPTHLKRLLVGDSVGVATP